MLLFLFSGLQYMVGQKRPHAGFPEMALTKYAERLVKLGYKVGQVDQTETPEQLKAYNQNTPKVRTHSRRRSK